jgi:hypothetical protein
VGLFHRPESTGAILIASDKRSSQRQSRIGVAHVVARDPDVHCAKCGLVVGPMRHPLDRADHYRNEAVKCHELAKHVQPAFLGHFYRRIAVR